MRNPESSETSSQINEKLKMHASYLFEEFTKEGKDPKTKVSKRDIIDFLDRHVPKGNFDKSLIEKLFLVMELEDENIVTVENFIKNYINLEDEVKNALMVCQKKLEQEKNKIKEYERQIDNYKGEEVNEDGLCEDTKLTVNLDKLECLENFQNFQWLKLSVIFQGEEKKTTIYLGDTIIELNKTYEL